MNDDLRVIVERVADGDIFAPKLSEAAVNYDDNDFVDALSTVLGGLDETGYPARRVQAAKDVLKKIVSEIVLDKEMLLYDLTINGVRYLFSFHVTILGRRVITHCLIDGPSGSFLGVAKRNPSDPFDLYEGRKIALDRALAAAGIAKDDYKIAIKRARKTRVK